MSETVKSIHNPSCACSCEVKFSGKAYSIEYCPMHKSAPDLLAACEGAHKMFCDSMFIWGKDDDEKVGRMTKAITLSIRKANTCPQ